MTQPQVKLYSQTNVLWNGNEAEYHNSASDLSTLMFNIQQALALDFHPETSPPDSITIHIYKETLDGED